mmetsp:Transcript_2100/g.7620  ORF Transcript_2100/g.7620 Transcript_2100/m.7620 type:complete len:207 (+) Transcript_2100:345-965(+)
MWLRSVQGRSGGGDAGRQAALQGLPLQELQCIAGRRLHRTQPPPLLQDMCAADKGRRKGAGAGPECAQVQGMQQATDGREYGVRRSVLPPELPPLRWLQEGVLWRQRHGARRQALLRGVRLQQLCAMRQPPWWRHLLHCQRPALPRRMLRLLHVWRRYARRRLRHHWRQATLPKVCQHAWRRRKPPCPGTRRHWRRMRRLWQQPCR